MDVYVCMCMGTCVCTNTWRPQDDVLSPLLISLHLIYSGGVSQLNLLLTDNLSLASQPAQVMSLLS